MVSWNGSAPVLVVKMLCNLNHFRRAVITLSKRTAEKKLWGPGFSHLLGTNCYIILPSLPPIKFPITLFQKPGGSWFSTNWGAKMLYNSAGTGYQKMLHPLYRPRLAQGLWYTGLWFPRLGTLLVPTHYITCYLSIFPSPILYPISPYLSEPKAIKCQIEATPNLLSNQSEFNNVKTIYKIRMIHLVQPSHR